MKLNTIEREVTTTGISSTSNFKIKATAKSFRILSSGIYQDKFKAIVRELSCNAFDAHVAANNLDKPFDVHLPTRLNPEFYIRDYGTGISPENIEKIYTTYFASTKDESNDFVGCMGLGSKTPFAYTDTFNVISYVDGMEYVYLIFVGQEGLPAFTQVAASPTTEPNGLKVSFSVVAESDMQNFVTSARAVYPLFSPKPNVLNGNFELPEVTKEVISDRAFFSTFNPVRQTSYSSYGYNGKVFAVMGNIVYPLPNNSTMAGAYTNIETILKYIQGTNYNLYIQFEIGDLEFTTSREELEATDSNYAVIETAILTEVMPNLFDKALSSILSHDTSSILKLKKVLNDWQRQSPYKFLAGITKFQEAVRDALPVKYSARNDCISTNIFRPYISIPSEYFFGKNGDKVIYTLHKNAIGNGRWKDSVIDVSQPRRDVNGRIISGQFVLYNFTKRAVHIFVNDIKSGGMARLNYAIKSGTIVPGVQQSCDGVVWIVAKDEKSAKRIQGQLCTDLVKICKASNFAAPPKKQAVAKATLDVFYKAADGSTFSAQYIQPQTLPLTEKFYYLTTHYSEYSFGKNEDKNKRTISELKPAMKLAKLKGFMDDKLVVYGVPDGKVRKVVKNYPNAINLTELLVDKFQTYINKTLDINLIHAWKRDLSYNAALTTFLAAIKNLGTRGNKIVLNKKVALANDLVPYSELFDYINLNFIEMLNIESDPAKIQSFRDKYHNLATVIQEVYPLLSAYLVSDRGSASHILSNSIDKNLLSDIIAYLNTKA